MDLEEMAQKAKVRCTIEVAVMEFFSPCTFPKGCNYSFIALIPKTQNAKTVKDFLPIMLIGSLYKIIAKILSNKLSSVNPDLISDVQSAFISNRKILDGSFILNELLSRCKYKKLKAMVFKVDFEKAFDSIRWYYLDDVLKSFGFRDKWRGWISGCLKSAKGMERINSWDDVVSNVTSRLSKWKLKTLFIGGTLDTKAEPNFCKRNQQYYQQQLCMSLMLCNQITLGSWKRSLEFLRRRNNSHWTHLWRLFTFFKSGEKKVSNDDFPPINANVFPRNKPRFTPATRSFREAVVGDTTNSKPIHIEEDKEIRAKLDRDLNSDINSLFEEEFISLTMMDDNGGNMVFLDAHSPRASGIQKFYSYPSPCKDNSLLVEGLEGDCFNDRHANSSDEVVNHTSVLQLFRQCI
nr:RNA-directed DNA polymerase, eukaryota, reverse transcriptase zinc-binding domain protein [Tanacetum cinerariifolium]